jgi:hypothetical protein
MQLTFEGMLVLFLKKGFPSADAGILRTAPGHDARLTLTEIPRGGQSKIIFDEQGAKVNKQYKLTVTADASRPVKIDVHENGASFDRKTHADITDFRWVLNYVGQEMYRNSITHDVKEFRAFLRMNAGTFFTQELSANNLALLRPGNPQPDVIGQVATKIRAEIKLIDDDVASFSTGSGKPIELTVHEGVDYELYFGLARQPPHHHTTDIDARNYHAALPKNKKLQERIDFDKEHSSLESNQDAACFSPGTDPPGFWPVS